MRVCDGLTMGTEKTEIPRGGLGGVFGLKPKYPPPKPQTPNAGSWHRSIGSAPKDGTWSLVAENAGWWLLLDESSKGKAWRKLKLGSKVVRAGGANFWLQWGGSEKEFGASTEGRRLVERFPEAAEWAIAKLVEANV